MCGGVVAVHQLTGDREARRCTQCQRYDVRHWHIGENPDTIEPVTVLAPHATDTEPLSLCSAPEQGNSGLALGTQTQGFFAF